MNEIRNYLILRVYSLATMLFRLINFDMLIRDFCKYISAEETI